MRTHAHHYEHIYTYIHNTIVNSRMCESTKSLLPSLNCESTGIVAHVSAGVVVGIPAVGY